MDGAKYCRSCDEWVPRSDFTPSKKAADGLQSYCRACYAKRAADRRRRNPEREKEISAKSIALHRDEINARKRARRLANPEKTKAERAASYAKRRERELDCMRRWRTQNHDAARQYQHDRYWADVESARERQMAYRRANPGKSRAWTMNRIARKLQATPKWANKIAIESIYKRAAALSRATGIPHEVDHIVPLRSKHVSGLHCETNLQILTRAENRKKSNHFNAAMAA